MKQSPGLRHICISSPRLVFFAFFIFCSTIFFFFFTIRLHSCELIPGRQQTRKMGETMMARTTNAHHWQWVRDNNRGGRGSKYCMFLFFSFTYFVFTKCFRNTVKIMNSHPHHSISIFRTNVGSRHMYILCSSMLFFLKKINKFLFIIRLCVGNCNHFILRFILCTNAYLKTG